MRKCAVIYARVSGDDRGKEGRNLAGQLEMGREHCTRRGHSIIAELSEDDRGASGAEFDLPQLNRVFDMAEAGEFDVLVVRELDRLSRNIAKQLTIESELKRHGVTIEYVLGEYPDTPEGRLNKHLRASIAEFEREQITLRMVRGRRQKVKAGNVLVAKRPPYGYRVIEGPNRRFALEVHEPEARIVRQIFDWYTLGDGEGAPMEINAITRKLTALGVLTPADTNHLKGGKGKKRGRGEWNRASVHWMLKNETYAGVWRFGKRNGRKRKDNDSENCIAVDVPAIIDREMWEAAQAHLEYNRRNGNRELKYPCLMRGRLTCGHCMSAMSCSPNKQPDKAYLYYRCNANRSTSAYAHRCDAKVFKVGATDEAIWAWVKRHLSDPAVLYESLTAFQADCDRETAPIKRRIDVVDGLLDDHRQQLNRLLDLYLSGDFEKDVLTDRKARLEETIAALEREQKSLASSLEKKTMSEEQLQRIMAFAERQAEKVEAATRDFAVRRALIEELDVRVTLVWENGEPVIYAQCILGEERLWPASNTLVAFKIPNPKPPSPIAND